MSWRDSGGPIMCVVGTRPEVIKMFPVIAGLQADGIETLLVNTGQHSSLCTDALDSFGLRADVDLAVMAHDQTPTEVAAKVLSGIGPYINGAKPSWLVVQGDTTTVLAAAIAGCYERVAVAHVEAGLRSHDPAEPFPEELNRKAVTAISTMHFAPTARSKDALLREGVDESDILLTGNTVIDSLHWAGAHEVSRTTNLAIDGIDGIDPDRPLLLLTTHRRENFGERLSDIFAAVHEATEERPDLQVLFPVHPNPAVRRTADEVLGDNAAVTMTEPLDYLDLAWVLRRAAVVLTDSGGLQEEAPALGKRVLVLRDVTERPEAIECGAAELVGTSRATIVKSVLHSLDHPLESIVSPYGDGRAGIRIARALQRRPVDPFDPETVAR